LVPVAGLAVLFAGFAAGVDFAAGFWVAAIAVPPQSTEPNSAAAHIRLIRIELPILRIAFPPLGSKPTILPSLAKRRMVSVRISLCRLPKRDHLHLAQSVKGLL
jgi:hypothetical protein